MLKKGHFCIVPLCTHRTNGYLCSTWPVILLSSLVASPTQTILSAHLRVPRETSVRGGVGLEGGVVVIVAAADEAPPADEGPDAGVVERDGVTGDVVGARSEVSAQVDEFGVALDVLVARANHKFGEY